MYCIAIDDEPIALQIIAAYCQRYGRLHLETFTSPQAGLRRIRETKPDIVFLDIELNGESGLSLARKLPATCCLIFTTAFANYALDGFDANAVDFLHKPYFYDRFKRAIEKAELWLRMHDLLRNACSPTRKLTIKSEYKNVTLAIDEMVYAESLDNYVRVHLADGTSLCTKTTLSAFFLLLPPEEFVRIHRSFLVARSRIARYTHSEVRLTMADIALPVGKKYAAALFETLGEAPRQ